MNIRDYILEKKREILAGRLTSSRFQDFLRKNGRPIETLFTYYECALMEVETKFKVLNQEYTLIHDRNPIESIKTRLKTMESLVEKVGRIDIPLTVDAIEENINDIAGIRVICSFVEDIYTLAECLLEQDDVTLICKKDYIKNPKENGYRSLHLIITVPIYLEHRKKDMKVEVQLRTIAMDFWASLEHKLKYKKDLPPDISKKLYAELLDCANTSADLDMRMQSIRKKLAEETSDVDDLVESRQWL